MTASIKRKHLHDVGSRCHAVEALRLQLALGSIAQLCHFVAKESELINYDSISDI
jgi:hypothetical protein